MSSSGGGAGEGQQRDLFSTTKNKMKVQQRMIDLTFRELQSTRSSSRTISETSSPGSAIQENILLVENKLMKLFSRQLMHKHICLKELRDSSNLEQTSYELDELISLEMFLTVACMEQRATKALLDGKEGLSVDKLFQMTPQELQEIFMRLEMTTGDCHKLVSLLDLMTHYYEIWEKGEKPTAGAYDIRRNSSSGRLNSLTSLDSRKDSCSSHTVSPPAGNQCSRSSTPLTPLTPSTYSPFPGGLPHQSSVPAMPTHLMSESSGHFTGGSSSCSSGSVYNTLSDISSGQLLSSSLSSLNSDLSTSQQGHSNDGIAPLPTAPSSLNASGHHSKEGYIPPTSVNEVSFLPPPHHFGTSSSNLKAKRKLGHTRSHSNPPLANLIMPEVVPENSIPDYRSPSPPYYNGHVPPTRTGSHPSIIHNSVSQSSSSTKSHPQVRRLMASSTHVFSRSVSTDLGDVQPDPPMRSNSEASGVQSSSPRQRRLSKEAGTSTSMVDLPLIRCNGDQLENGLPSTSVKSHSVPRLVNLVVNPGENTSHHSVSVPTSPRLPNNYNPTGVLGHKIDHKFVNNLFFGVQECDKCKKSLVMNGVKCRYCKYKCHKHCAKLAPPNCGLTQDFIDYAKQHLMMSPSNENIHQVNNSSAATPTMMSPPKLSRSGEYSSSTKSDDTFVIQDLNREPSNSQYSPVVTPRRHHHTPTSPAHDQGRSLGPIRLEVPQLFHPSPLHARQHRPRSTSSSPSTSSQSSPCLTPISPRSPLDSVSMEYPSYLHRSIAIVLTDNSDESPDEEYNDMHQDSEGFSSDSSSSNFGDTPRMGVPNGLRPPARGIAAQSLPNLLLAEKRQMMAASNDSTGSVLYTSSEDNLQSWFVPRKASLAGTISTADSKTSTLVGSIMEDDDDSYDESEGIDSQGALDDDYVTTGRTKIRHRNSVVDEWIIPYSDLKLVEELASGPVVKVHKGYWHGDVAIKTFVLPNATNKQLAKFREEVAVLKKTRHENLALFMGACLTPPNLAIITSYCRGYTLYKQLHYWSEVFSLERLVNAGRQIAQAMGYLHARGIIHKGLNTKNIFLEKTTDQKEKVVITDMGLSSLSSILSKNNGNESGLCFPRTHLYSLAPEIIQLIGPNHPRLQLERDMYPYTFATDIYAFGTILYELITRRYPFSVDNFGFAYESEVVVFLVGRGERQVFKNTDVPKQLKDIVWQCWSYGSYDRPKFSELKERLARMCRKHTPITRSPSHPINLSKSVDNLLHI